MIRKKNYKQQQHFTQLHTFTAYAPATATHGPKKYQIYYKRYRKQNQSQNIYNIIHNINQQNSNGENVAISQYPVDRTLELLSFDGNLEFLKKYLRKIGKIRQYETGEGLYKGQKIHTAMCVFKFQFDLVKCFRDDYLQTKIDQVCLINSKAITQDDREEQRHQLIQKHMQKQLSDKIQKLKQLQKDGYQVVTDIYGQYRMDYQANQKFVENLPQIKRRKKREEKERRLREERLRQAKEQIANRNKQTGN